MGERDGSFGDLGSELLLYKFNIIQIAMSKMQALLATSCENLNQFTSLLCTSLSLHVKYGQYLSFMVVPSSKQLLCMLHCAGFTSRWLVRL